MTTLNPTIQNLLNAFSQSQPALNLVGVPSVGLHGAAAPGSSGVPSGRSGIQLGDLLAQALAGNAASASAYTPTTPSNWGVTPPTTVGAALDDVAPSKTAGQPYTPAVPSNWSGAAPTTIQQALDRVAAALVAAGHTA